MYKVDIVYICQMDFNNERSYREIICSGKPELFFLQFGRATYQHQTLLG